MRNNGKNKGWDALSAHSSSLKSCFCACPNSVVGLGDLLVHSLALAASKLAGPRRCSPFPSIPFPSLFSLSGFLLLMTLLSSVSKGMVDYRL